MVAIGVFIVAEPALNALLNFWLEKIFNEAVVGAELILIIRLLVIGFSVWIARRLVIFLTSIVTKSFLCNIKLNIKSDIFNNIIGMNTSDISMKASSGEYMSVFINDIIILEQRYLNRIITLVASIVSVVINGAAFIYMNVKLAVPIIIFGIIILVFPAIVAKSLSNIHLNYSNKLSKFTQKLKELLIAYPTIKNYAVEKPILDKFDDFNLETEEAQLETEYGLILSTDIGTMMSWFMQIIAIGLGLIMVINGEIMLGTVVAVRGFASSLADPLQDIVGSVISIRSVKGVVEKMRDLSELAPTEEKRVDEEAIPDVRDVEFNDVSLIRGEKQIIKGFSHKFEQGKKYLIVGENGSGKSTLCKILTRRIPDFTGSVHVRGKNLRNYTSSELSNIVSYLNENVYLLTGSVKDNISLYRDFDDAAIAEATKEAQVKLDITRNVWDGGTNISSGEQRRIELARSMLSKVDVLIFDEVVSTLDIKTAYEIEKMVLEYSDKTVIFISHNFSGKLIREYDEILIMDGGTLAASGTYEELIASNEYFREICQIKFGNI